jgi:ankyrin repeat protein
MNGEGSKKQNNSRRRWYKPKKATMDVKRNDSPLIIAVTDGNIELVKTLLSDKNIDVNAKDKNGETAIMLAPNMEIFKLLLEHKDLDVNIYDNHKATILLNAIKAKLDDVVALLLQREDIDVNYHTDQTDSPLEIAFYDGYSKAGELLLNHPSINVNTGVLNACVKKNYYDVVKRLLQHKDIDVNFTSEKFIMTPLFHVKDSKMLQLLLSHPDIDVNFNKTTNGLTPLMFYCFNKSVDLVKILIQRSDVNVNIKNKNDDAALILAVWKDSIEIVQLLLNRDELDVNVKNRDNVSSLIFAVNNSNLEMIELLLSQTDIDINAKQENGNTVLINAIHKNINLDVIKLLLNRDNIDVNAKENSGYTALMVAVNNSNLDAVKLLLSRDDIDVDAKNNNGKSALDYAKDSAIRALLLKHQPINKTYLASNSEEIQSKCKENRVDMITRSELYDLDEVVTIKLPDGTFVCYSPYEIAYIQDIFNSFNKKNKNSFKSLRDKLVSLGIKDISDHLFILNEIDQNKDIQTIIQQRELNKDNINYFG